MDKRQKRFEEFTGICMTISEFEGVKLFMEVEELIKENKNAYEAFEKIINDYHAHEVEASAETKFLMLINKWESPFIACTELVKRIETNETMLKNICKVSGTTLKKIGYVCENGKRRKETQNQRIIRGLR